MIIFNLVVWLGLMTNQFIVTTSRSFWWNEIKDLMTRIKMHISKVKLPFYPPCEVKCGLQNRVSTPTPPLQWQWNGEEFFGWERPWPAQCHSFLRPQYQHNFPLEKEHRQNWSCTRSFSMVSSVLVVVPQVKLWTCCGVWSLAIYVT